MPDFFDYDPVKGISRHWDYADGTAWVRTEQDVEPVLDYALEQRNQGKKDRGDFRLFAKIPAVVEYELMKKGIVLGSKDPTMQRRLLQEIDQNYPYLKTTYKKYA